LWFSLKAVDSGYYACIVAVYVYQSRLWDSEWVEIGVLEEETKEHVDSVGLCKPAIHIAEWCWDVSLP